MLNYEGRLFTLKEAIHNFEIENNIDINRDKYKDIKSILNYITNPNNKIALPADGFTFATIYKQYNTDGVYKNYQSIGLIATHSTGFIYSSRISGKYEVSDFHFHEISDIGIMISESILSPSLVKIFCIDKKSYSFHMSRNNTIYFYNKFLWLSIYEKIPFQFLGEEKISKYKVYRFLKYDKINKIVNEIKKKSKELIMEYEDNNATNSITYVDAKKNCADRKEEIIDRPEIYHIECMDRTRMKAGKISIELQTLNNKEEKRDTEININNQITREECKEILSHSCYLMLTGGDTKENINKIIKLKIDEMMKKMVTININCMMEDTNKIQIPIIDYYNLLDLMINTYMIVEDKNYIESMRGVALSVKAQNTMAFFDLNMIELSSKDEKIIEKYINYQI